MEAHPESIFYSGADVNDIVVGLEPVNKGLRLQLKQEQAKGFGNQIVGRFKLLESGEGDYSTYLNELVGETATAIDFVERLLERINVDQQRPLKVLHIFNCNMLGIDRNAT